MPRSILFCAFACVIFSCQSSEHGKEAVAVDSLRTVLATHKNLLRSFPSDSLLWSAQEIDQQQLLLSNLTDSAYWTHYSEYFSLSKNIKTILQWHANMLPLLSQDEMRLHAIKDILKNNKGKDEEGNSITNGYFEECIAIEKSHSDSIGQSILEHYTQSIQAIQMVRWMLPIMQKEIENIKANQE